MRYTQPFICRTVLVASLACLASLAGCGSGGANAPEAGGGNGYADTLAYCAVQEPSGVDAQPRSWSVTAPSHGGSPRYDVAAIVSPAGASAPTMPVRLQVDARDYRGVSANSLLPGYANPLWKMGIKLAPMLPSRSAACVAGLAKLSMGVNSGGVGVVTSFTWSSKWSSSVSLAGLPGQVVDGFEFVGNFAPTDASAFFVVPKAWVPVGQSLSVCYRAPSAERWDCGAAGVTDAGNEWVIARAGAQSGVYVLAAPEPG